MATVHLLFLAALLRAYAMSLFTVAHLAALLRAGLKEEMCGIKEEMCGLKEEVRQMRRDMSNASAAHAAASLWQRALWKPRRSSSSAPPRLSRLLRLRHLRQQQLYGEARWAGSRAAGCRVLRQLRCRGLGCCSGCMS